MCVARLQLSALSQLAQPVPLAVQVHVIAGGIDGPSACFFSAVHIRDTRKPELRASKSGSRVLYPLSLSLH
jgi:hypothetical protein